MKPKKRLPAVVKTYLEGIGRNGGQSTSAKKGNASRENGAQGGRPKRKR